jgi:hypothetical protein
VLGDLKAIRADIVPNGIGVHPLAALDGIACLRGDGRDRVEEKRCCTRHLNETFHDHDPLHCASAVSFDIG